MPGVVLDAVAIADLPDHLEIEHRALAEPLGLEQLALPLQRRAPRDQFRLDPVHRTPRVLARRDEVGSRKDRHPFAAADGAARQRIEREQFVDLVAEQTDPKRLLVVRRKHLDDVAAHAERAAPELDVVPLVLNLHQAPEDLFALDSLPPLERHQHAVVRLRRSEPVDARDAGHDDDVAALEERPRGRQTHPVDLVVDRRFLLDVGVAGGDVRLGLVIVVVADEVLDRVRRKEPAEFLVQLRRQRLVVDHHERWSVHLRDDLRHRERLAGPRDAEQDLVAVAPVQALGELDDGARLVAAQVEVGHELKAVRHAPPLLVRRQRSEIPLPGADLDVLHVRAHDANLDLSPRPVRLRRCRHVPHRILGVDLRGDPRVHAVEVLDRGREERLPARDLGHPPEPALLVQPVARRLMLQEPDGVHRHVGRLQEIEHVAEGDAAPVVASVGVEHQDLPPVLVGGAVEVDAGRVPQGGAPPFRLPAPNPLDEAAELRLAVARDAHLGVELDQRVVPRVLEGVEEPDGRRAGQMDVGVHAAADVEQRAQVEFRRRRRSMALTRSRVARHEEPERLPLPVFVDLEVLLLEVRQEAALPVDDGHADVDHVDAASKRRLTALPGDDNVCRADERGRDGRFHAGLPSSGRLSGAALASWCIEYNKNLAPMDRHPSVILRTPGAR